MLDSFGFKDFRVLRPLLNTVYFIYIFRFFIRNKK